ncbi:CPCC family cysteine-rich protein [Sulfurospirillum multivorans]|uniref:Cys_rich_CPCC superfamily protein n=2 Tax=Sulfurospirillum multivorans TaxID=66821 RepID=A0AA86APL7_SULMK|nr:CPCC family cysteine-rich protein [Sulfurospirillum multivorans]AHJ13318.1 Cys_rich_CPCC superfamily protein [Sulfurospirillum multivorans DSM 12446]QEH06808.1 Cys_rich_CPCC superfamily protein [Sulfurospirillum multivorans]
MKYKCPCCGYYTFGEKPNGSYVICPVCFWEDDFMQLEDSTYGAGANEFSLLRAQRNFKLFGASEKEMVIHVRRPKEDEMQGID